MNTEFKGTKGKWYVRKEYNRGIDKHALTIRADIEGSMNGESVVLIGMNKKNSFPEFQSANAQAISKVPEMIEMLNKVEDFLIRQKFNNISNAIDLHEEIQKLLKETTTILI